MEKEQTKKIEMTRAEQVLLGGLVRSQMTKEEQHGETDTLYYQTLKSINAKLEDRKGARK